MRALKKQKMSYIKKQQQIDVCYAASDDHHSIHSVDGVARACRQQYGSILASTMVRMSRISLVCS